MKKHIVLSLLFAAGSLMSCSSDPLFELEVPEYFIIEGDTLKIRENRSLAIRNENFFIAGDTSVPVVSWKLTPERINPGDVEILKKGITDPEQAGRPLRMIAIGGGPVAGIRNGGYTNENMRTSFPSLVANQMGIAFNSPYFEEEDGNGYGGFLPTTFNPTGGPLQKFKVVNNNLAVDYIDKQGKPVLKPLKGDKQLDHFAVVQFPGYTKSSSLDPYSDPSVVRLLNGGKEKYANLRDRVLDEKFDFVLEGSRLSQTGIDGTANGGNHEIFENGLEGYVDERPGCVSVGCFPKFSDRFNFLLELRKRGGTKGVLYTSIPTHIQPFTQTFKVEEVRSHLSMYQKDFLLPADAMFVVPYPSVDSLMGSKVNMNIKPFINQRPQYSHQYVNLPYFSITDRDSALERIRKETYSLSKQLNWAVVDITNIYRDIMNNNYVSPDGFRIDSKQFFAEDGFSPSLLGQVVLANETIKSINSHYGTSIPYVKFSTTSKR